jgi:capsular polysaccharide biosynthesis protein
VTNPVQHIQSSLARRADDFLRTTRALSAIRIDHAVDVESVQDDSIANLQILVPARSEVPLGVNAHDHAFLQVCRHYRSGSYASPAILTCEVPDAYCHIGTGLVCTRDFYALNESQMKYRMEAGPAAVGNRIYRPFRWFKPRRAPRLSGLYATIGNVYQNYWGHWLFDCLPRLYSLQKAAGGQRVILLVPEDMASSWFDSLDCVLPRNFMIQRLPADSWFQVDRLLLASYATGLANSHMPAEFYDFMRKACFTQLGLPLENKPSERFYVSRAGTQHRRILNEDALIGLLQRYGFKTVRMEELDFKAQVELFHRAEIVVAAEGSNWANMLFAGRIKICVLYANREPNTHWFTAAKGLGQEHYFLTTDGEMHADFRVHLAELERLLIHEMGLSPTVED